MKGGIERGWQRKTQRRSTEKQRLAGQRNWQRLSVLGAIAQTRRIAVECGFSRKASSMLQRELSALLLCVDVNWYKQRRQVK